MRLLLFIVVLFLSKGLNHLVDILMHAYHFLFDAFHIMIISFSFSFIFFFGRPHQSGVAVSSLH